MTKLRIVGYTPTGHMTDGVQHFFVVRVSRSKYTPKRDEGSPAWRRSLKAAA